MFVVEFEKNTIVMRLEKAISRDQLLFLSLEKRVSDVTQLEYIYTLHVQYRRNANIQYTYVSHETMFRWKVSNLTDDSFRRKKNLFEISLAT